MKRRDFLRVALWGGSIAGLGGLAALAASRWTSSRTSAPGDARTLGDGFRYDVSGFQKTDPKLVLYRESERVDVRLQTVRHIAVGSGDRVFVAGERVVRQVLPARDAGWEIRLTHPPRCVTVAEDGDIFVGLKDRIEVFGGDGAPRAAWESLGSTSLISSIAVTRDDVFVADAGNRVVLRLDRSGKLVRRIGEKDPARNIPGFVIPSPYFRVHVAPDGLLRVTSPGRHRIETYTLDGDIGTWWGKPSLAIDGFCGCCNPVDFGIFPDGSYVTCEKGMPRVKVYDAEGRFVGVVAGTEQFPEYIKAASAGDHASTQAGLYAAIDSRQRVLILDVVARRILVMEKSVQA